MRKKLVPRLIFLLFISLFLFKETFADVNWLPAKEGDKVILIRHALAPGSGDPEGFNLKDCSTQRNLDQVGINQSKKIGQLFKKNNISIDQVLSSQWCRCKDTAKYAFKKYKEFSPLNSTFQSPYKKKAEQQMTSLQKVIRDIEQELAEPSIYDAEAKQKLKNMLTEQASAKSQLEKVEIDWLEATDNLEQKTQQAK